MVAALGTAAIFGIRCQKRSPAFEVVSEGCLGLQLRCPSSSFRPASIGWFLQSAVTGGWEHSLSWKLTSGSLARCSGVLSAVDGYSIIREFRLYQEFLLDDGLSITATYSTRRNSGFHRHFDSSGVIRLSPTFRHTLKNCLRSTNPSPPRWLASYVC